MEHMGLLQHTVEAKVGGLRLHNKSTYGEPGPVEPHTAAALMHEWRQRSNMNLDPSA